jgi:hypothetical protein
VLVISSIWTNIAEQDFGLNSKEMQNDVDNAGRHLQKGDKFGYNYNFFVQNAMLHGHRLPTIVSTTGRSISQAKGVSPECGVKV